MANFIDTNTTPHKNFIFRYSVEIVIIGLVLSLNVYIALAPVNNLLNWFNIDDSFYYFLVARNIAGGNGVTFDGINPANGFHPLWMLFCIPVFAVSRDNLWLPLRSIIILFGILQSASLIMIYHILHKKISGYLSAVLTLLFGLGSSVYTSIFAGGLESALSFFMILLLLSLGYRFRHDKHNTQLLLWIGIIAGLALLSRLDNIFLVTFLGIWLVFDKVEDAASFLTDIIAASLIVTVSAICRLGFNLTFYYRTILTTILLLAGVGSLANFVIRFFSCFSFKTIQKQIIRILFNQVFVTLTIALITWILFLTGKIETWSRSLLLLVSLGWLLYTVLKWKIVTPKSPQFLNSPDHYKPLRPMISRWIMKLVAYFLPISLLLGGYFVWSQINFDTPMPISGQIKVWWGTLGNTVYGASIRTSQEMKTFLFGNSSPFSFLYDTFSPVLAILKLPAVKTGILCWGFLLLIFLFLIAFKQKAQIIEWLTSLYVLPIAAGILIRIIYFYLSGYVHLRKWYWGGETLFIFFLFVTIIGSLWMIKTKFGILQKFIEISASIAMILVIGALIRNISSTYSWSDDQNTVHEYMAVTQEIEGATEEGSVIGIPGGGAISYFIQDRTIVNLDGLMNSKEYFDDLKKFDTHDFMKKMEVQYIYANEYMAEDTLPFSKIFENHLTRKTMINNRYLYWYEQELRRKTTEYRGFNHFIFYTMN